MLGVSKGATLSPTSPIQSTILVREDQQACIILRKAAEKEQEGSRKQTTAEQVKVDCLSKHL